MDQICRTIDVPGEVEEMIDRVHTVVIGRPNFSLVLEQGFDGVLIAEANRIAQERDVFHGGEGSWLDNDLCRAARQPTSRRIEDSK